MINILYLVLTALSVLDFLTTKIIIESSGYYMEVNPFLHYLITTFDSVWIIFVFKAITLLFFGFVLSRLQLIKERIITDNVIIITLVGLNILYAIIVIKSFYILNTVGVI